MAGPERIEGEKLKHSPPGALLATDGAGMLLLDLQIRGWSFQS